MPENFKPAMGGGDKGLTDLPRGLRVKKTDARIKAIGLIDELSALLGLVRAGLPAKQAGEFHQIQRSLLKAAAHAAGMDLKEALETEAAFIETRIDGLSRELKPGREFVLPGRTRAEALIHLARAKARICEISLWEINSRPAAVYLNRLSDLLFLLGCKNHHTGAHRS